MFINLTDTGLSLSLRTLPPPPPPPIFVQEQATVHGIFSLLRVLINTLMNCYGVVFSAGGVAYCKKMTCMDGHTQNIYFNTENFQITVIAM